MFYTNSHRVVIAAWLNTPWRCRGGVRWGVTCNEQEAVGQELRQEFSFWIMVNTGPNQEDFLVARNHSQNAQYGNVQVSFIDRSIKSP